MTASKPESTPPKGQGAEVGAEETEVGPAMGAQCASCARPLASAKAVCLHCEPALAKGWPLFADGCERYALGSRPRDMQVFRLQARAEAPPLHTCPACGYGFDLPDKRLKPEKAPWWRFQGQVHCCPQCRTELVWQPSPLIARARKFYQMAPVALFMALMAARQYKLPDAPSSLWATLLTLNVLTFVLCRTQLTDWQHGDDQWWNAGRRKETMRIRVARYLATGQMVLPSAVNGWGNGLLFDKQYWVQDALFWLTLVFRALGQMLQQVMLLPMHAAFSLALVASVVHGHALERRALRQVGW